MRARDNPFSSERVLRVRYQPQGWTWDELLNRLRALRFRSAIVGPEGSGKTTLLEDLAGILSDRGYVTRHCQLTTESRSFRAADWRRITRQLGPRDIVLLDGCEQLSWIRWHRFRLATRGAGGLIVTTHFPGRLPTLLRTTTSPSLLAHVVRQLTGQMPDHVDDLHGRHRGNLREAIRELYDCAATRPSNPQSAE